MVVRSVRRQLTSLGRVDLVDAPSVARARDVVRASSAQLAAALVDVTLPDGSGLDVIALAKTLDPTLPVAAVTGHETPDIKNRACELGAFFLPKPIETSSLLAFCRRAIRERGQNRARVAAVSQEWARELGLSAAELDVLLLTADGFSPSEISERRGCSVGTIHKLGQALARKAGESSPASAALRFMRELARFTSTV